MHCEAILGADQFVKRRRRVPIGTGFNAIDRSMLNSPPVCGIIVLDAEEMHVHMHSYQGLWNYNELIILSIGNPL